MRVALLILALLTYTLSVSQFRVKKESVFEYSNVEIIKKNEVIKKQVKVRIFFNIDEYQNILLYDCNEKSEIRFNRVQPPIINSSSENNIKYDYALFKLYSEEVIIQFFIKENYVKIFYSNGDIYKYF